MTTPRRATSYFYRDANTVSTFIDRGGASYTRIEVQNIEAVARSMNIFSLSWRDYAYPLVLISDAYWFPFQSPTGRTLGVRIGAAEYVATNVALQSYTGHNVGTWNSAGVYIHDTTTWVAEWTMITGIDVTTLQIIWISTNAGNANFVYASISAGALHITTPGSAANGPNVSPSATYHVVVVYNAGVMTFYVNTIATAATGTLPAAQAVGTSPIIYIGSNQPSGNPFLGSLAMVVFWKVSITVQQIVNHYNAIFVATTTVLFGTIALPSQGTAFAECGQGKTFPLADRMLIQTTGECFILVTQEE